MIASHARIFSGAAVEEQGYFTAVAQQPRGRWLLRDDHWSVTTPPPAVP